MKMTRDDVTTSPPIGARPMSLRVAISGTGGIARAHAAAIQALAEVELVALVNHQPQSMARFGREHEVTRQHGSVTGLLARGGVDALVVCTPNALHAPQAVEALRAGVHVLVEKPMAMNVVEAEAMCRAAETAGARLMVAHCWRFDAEVRWLRQIVQSGRLGRVVRTRGVSSHVDWGPGGWFTDPALAGGGALVDMGVHAIDTARFLLGDPAPVAVTARVGTCYTTHEVDDTCVLLIDWEGGAHSFVETGWWQPHADGPEAATQVYGVRGHGQVFPTRARVRAGERVEDLEGGQGPRIPHCAQAMYDRQVAHFCDAIRAGVPFEAEGRLALGNQRILDAAYLSARESQTVSVATSEDDPW
jgi:predicted dehydrogenase